MTLSDFIKFMTNETNYTKEQLYNMTITELYQIVLKRFNKRISITLL